MPFMAVVIGRPTDVRVGFRLTEPFILFGTWDQNYIPIPPTGAIHILGRAVKIPFEHPTRYLFVINLKIAKSIDREASPTILALADGVIECADMHDPRCCACH
jgi:hypothetical protein